MRDIGAVARAFGTTGPNFTTKAGLNYTSGWIDISDKQGQYFNLTHNLNSTNIMVEIQGKTANDAMEYMEKTYPGIPFVYTHSVPAGLYKDEPNRTPRGCYRAIPDDEAIRAAKSGGYVAPTFTEWMMDGVWPDDITPKQAADIMNPSQVIIGDLKLGQSPRAHKAMIIGRALYILA